MKATRLIALTFAASAAVLASPAFAQPDTQAPPPGPARTLSEHRIAALKKCTEGIRFADKMATDKYTNCMTAQGEEP